MLINTNQKKPKELQADLSHWWAAANIYDHITHVV